MWDVEQLSAPPSHQYFQRRDHGHGSSYPPSRKHFQVVVVIVFVYFPTRTLAVLTYYFESFRIGKVPHPKHGDLSMAVGRPLGALILQRPPQKSIDSIAMTSAGAPKPTSARNEDEEPQQCRGVDISSLCAGSGTWLLLTYPFFVSDQYQGRVDIQIIKFLSGSDTK